jgi:D-methionine transport system ATP-binding protein
LATQPDILLCDEATSALDPETTRSVLALLADLNREMGLTIVLITHEMAVVRAICDHVAVLDQGRLIEAGPVDSVFAGSQEQATLALLGEDR